MSRLLVALLLSFLAIPALGASMPPVWATDGLVVTSVEPAADAGRRILLKGGNATDAAIATSFAASVAHPFSSGLGGGMFAVLWVDGKAEALDARETAPAGVDAAAYAGDPGLSRRGPLAVAVPGLVQGLWALHQRHGSLTWAELIDPAIELAENGVTVGLWHRRIARAAAERLQAYPETARIQLDDGKAPELGWVLVQKDLANTLRHIQRAGGRALAEGDYAERIAKATDGAITVEDLGDYRAVWREPTRGHYRGREVIGMPPPSSGGVLITAMLNMLEPFDLKALGHNSAQYIHLVAEVMKLAFADRARHLGDPDCCDLPIARLMSTDYARERLELLRFPPGFEQRPTWPEGPPYAVQVEPGLMAPPDDSGTTHISVMDRDGNGVAITQSVNGLYGALITVPGTGIVLNNEMDDFAMAPNAPNLWEAIGEKANAVGPGKRPLSSMSPTLLVRNGRVDMVVGSPMGTTIISSVLQGILNVVDFDMNPQQAVAAPRFHHQWSPDRLSMEPEFSAEVRDLLAQWGHPIHDRSIMGAVEMVVFDERECVFFGGVDGRRDSGAAAVILPEGPSVVAGRGQRCRAAR